MSSSLERRFIELWLTINPDVVLVAESQIIPDRKFRFDFYHPQSVTAIEIQGGIWGKGGHSSGKGISRDCEKYTLAFLHGVRVVLLTKDMISENWLTSIGDRLRMAENTLFE